MYYIVSLFPVLNQTEGREKAKGVLKKALGKRVDKRKLGGKMEMGGGEERLRKDKKMQIGKKKQNNKQNKNSVGFVIMAVKCDYIQKGLIFVHMHFHTLKLPNKLKLAQKITTDSTNQKSEPLYC